METLPPELIAMVVGHVSHRKSLESLSLVSSIFRDPAQQRLLRALKLCLERRPNSTLARKTFLEASSRFNLRPRLAAYVVDLNISFGRVKSLEDSQLSLVQQVLSQLGSAPRVELLTIPWNNSPRIVAVVEHWISSGAGFKQVTLWDFYVVPDGVLHSALVTTRSLKLKNYEPEPMQSQRIQGSVELPVSRVSYPTPRQESPSAYVGLLRYVPLISFVRSLTALARLLSMLLSPRLAPTLSNITITVRFDGTSPMEPLPVAQMRLLDDLLSSHPSLAHVVWPSRGFIFRRNSQHAWTPFVSAFANMVYQAMPKTAGKRMLVVGET
uniref:F-box domain-containing protein n=1 Tax=Mycena chlorophos TaxID=658473 RepID=A0ABQ0LAH3_MYCCL|nr:predicted protein [Mycena chlorophos]